MQLKELDLDKEKLPIERALGIEWNTESDFFAIKVAIKDRALTRRGILSMVSSIYDPLGFLSPFTLKAKQILQGLCKLKSGWDQIIPEDFSNQWQRWSTGLEQLSRFTVDRCMKPEDFGPIRTAELHTSAMQVNRLRHCQLSQAHQHSRKGLRCICSGKIKSDSSQTDHDTQAGAYCSSTCRESGSDAEEGATTGTQGLCFLDG
jgi:hypothetical protein